MKVKDFLSVCTFEPQEIKDFSGNIYLLNGRKYARIVRLSTETRKFCKELGGNKNVENK